MAAVPDFTARLLVATCVRGGLVGGGGGSPTGLVGGGGASPTELVGDGGGSPSELVGGGGGSPSELVGGGGGSPTGLVGGGGGSPTGLVGAGAGSPTESWSDESAKSFGGSTCWGKDEGADGSAEGQISPADSMADCNAAVGSC